MILLFKRSLRKIKKFVIPEKKIEIKEEITYEQKRAIIDSYREKFDLKILVETGTFLGDTIFYFKDKFQELYSIELSEELAERAKLRFVNDKNITIMQGDSAKVLNGLKDSLSKNALFWLDGHYSSEFFYNGEYIKTAKADKNTPIEDELDILLASEFNNVILIDDARLFVGKSDYPTVDKIKEKVKATSKPFSVYVDTDIIHIVSNQGVLS